MTMGGRTCSSFIGLPQELAILRNEAVHKCQVLEHDSQDVGNGA